MKSISIIFTIMMSIFSYAHQSDLSTTVLSKTNDGKYILQVTCSLTAFEGEINYLYTKEAYKTPEEFKDLVIDHFSKHISIIINEKDTLFFKHPLVILGHETKLVMEVANMPKEVHSIYLRNQTFKDIHHNQMAVFMTAEGFPKKQYVLNNDNHQTLNIKLENGVWETIEPGTSNTVIYLLAGLGILILFGIAFYILKKKQ